MKTSEVLDGAINLLKTCGWIQGGLGSFSQGYCAFGAIERSATSIITLTLAVLAAETAIGGRTPLASWNDAPGRTKEQVVEALVKAKAAAEACARTWNSFAIDRV